MCATSTAVWYLLLEFSIRFLKNESMFMGNRKFYQKKKAQTIHNDTIAHYLASYCIVCKFFSFHKCTFQFSIQYAVVIVHGIH